MPHTFRKKYEDQLPKLTRFTWENMLSAAGSVASLAGIYLAVSKWEALTDDDRYFYGITYLFALVCALLAFILVRESKKRHRFAQAIYHIHFVNHTIRDYLAGVQIGRHEALSTVLNEIVNAISAGFSIVEGRQCRCSIKEISREPRPQLVTKARDAISRVSSVNTQQYDHFLDANTDFLSLWNGAEGNVRFFRGVNLKRMWRRGEYSNSSFQAYGEPKRIDVLGYGVVTNWNLPYNSTMVWPIRYIPDHSYWPPARGSTNKELGPLERPDFWGFLCVDADTSRAFGSQQAWELGALFADALYTLFRQMAYMANQSPLLQSPTEVPALEPLSGGQPVASDLQTVPSVGRDR